MIVIIVINTISVESMNSITITHSIGHEVVSPTHISIKQFSGLLRFIDALDLVQMQTHIYSDESNASQIKH